MGVFLDLPVPLPRLLRLPTKPASSRINTTLVPFRLMKPSHIAILAAALFIVICVAIVVTLGIYPQPASTTLPQPPSTPQPATPQPAASPNPSTPPSPSAPATPSGTLNPQTQLPTYVVRGRVTQLPNPPKQPFEVHHEEIPGFLDKTGAVVGMKEMIMPFPDLAPGLSLAEFAPGDAIELIFEVRWNQPPRTLVTQARKLPPDVTLLLSKEVAK